MQHFARDRRSQGTVERAPWRLLAAVAAAALLTGVVRYARAPRVLAASAAPDAAVAGLKPKYADVAGVRARYYEMGQGEPMLLIHGGDWNDGSSANDFSTVLPLLAKSYHVYAPDRLGHGLTGNPELSKFNYQGEIEFLYQFMQTMKIASAHLVGHDSGGALALYLAITHPETAKSLVFIAPREDFPVIGALPSRFDAAVQECLDRPYNDAVKCKEAALSWLPNTFDDEYYQAAIAIGNDPKSLSAQDELEDGAGEPERTQNYAAWRGDLWARVQNDGVLQMPALVYAGHDDAADWSVGESTAQLRAALQIFDVLGSKNPRVQMIVMNNAGHFPFREHPEQFVSDLDHFLDYWAHAPALQPRMVPLPQVNPSSAPQGGGVSGAVPQIVLEQGQAVYYRACSVCHEDTENGAPSLDGLFGTAKMLNGNPVSDENVAKVLMQPDHLSQGLAQGTQGLTAQEISLVVQYLHTR